MRPSTIRKLYNDEPIQSLSQGDMRMTLIQPIQKILFGSPGTGKSYRIDHEIIPNDLEIDKSVSPENVIKTVFHPE